MPTGLYARITASRLRAIEGEKTGEPGYLEHLRGLRTGRSEHQIPFSLAQPPQAPNEHAERRRVNEPHSGEVHRDPVGAVRLESPEQLAKLRRGKRVEVTLDRHFGTLTTLTYNHEEIPHRVHLVHDICCNASIRSVDAG
ncbi:MAG TPA: hypothetical protein VHT75_16465 [Acidimicrobiales bacterium]|nr:hypothetical protein [Acidimicrobiales bacterium]